MSEITTRKGFEEWAMATGEVVSEDEDTYLLSLFGERMIVCPKSDASVTPCLIRDFGWEMWVSVWFLRNIEEDSLFIDIGANCGYYSVLASTKTFDVWAFEPNPDYIALLEETADLNWVDMQVFPCALSDRNDSAVLRIPGALEGSASLIESDFSRYDVREIEVSTRKLDDFVSANITQPVLIKVDAEGSEEMIWRGSEKFRTMYRPTFVMEYTPGAYSDEFVKSLEEYGHLSYIDFEGQENPISKDQMEANGDWMTIVVKPK